jgi:hypothetical protein
MKLSWLPKIRRGLSATYWVFGIEGGVTVSGCGVLMA